MGKENGSDVREEIGMYLAVQKESKVNIGEDCMQKKPVSVQIQNKHKDVRIQMKENRNKEPIQCFPKESRTLKHEAQRIKEPVEELTRKMQILEVESEFDEDLFELVDRRDMLVVMNETLHHILPRNAIAAFIGQLNADEKKEILLEFVRFNPGNDSDVTVEEYEQIQGGNQEKIEEMLPRVLMSLRSNLTSGPNKRSDDPKGKADDFDPNYSPGGGLDEISRLYRIAYDAIKSLNGIDSTREGLIKTIKEILKEAERKLAEKQGIVGEDAYKHTKLEPGNFNNWVLPTENEGWKKKRN